MASLLQLYFAQSFILQVMESFVSGIKVLVPEPCMSALQDMRCSEMSIGHVSLTESGPEKSQSADVSNLDK